MLKIQVKKQRELLKNKKKLNKTHNMSYAFCYRTSLYIILKKKKVYTYIYYHSILNLLEKKICNMVYHL